MEHQLPFVLLEVSLQDAGAYSCQAMLSDGSTEGPVSAGNLNVLGKIAILSIGKIYIMV